MANITLIQRTRRNGVRVEFLGKRTVLWFKHTRPELINLAKIVLQQLATCAENTRPPGKNLVMWCVLQPPYIQARLIRIGIYPRESVAMNAWLKNGTCWL